MSEAHNTAPGCAKAYGAKFGEVVGILVQGLQEEFMGAKVGKEMGG